MGGEKSRKSKKKVDKKGTAKNVKGGGKKRKGKTKME